MKLWHVTTPKKYNRYEVTGHIIKPVRGWSTEAAALLWARKTSRSIIISFESTRVYKLPDHRNRYGRGYWADENIDMSRITVKA